MPEASYIGNTSYQLFSFNETEGEELDTLSYVLKGNLTDLDTESAYWTRGKVGASIGYPNMYLQSKNVSVGGGSSFATITLNFAGFLTSELNNPIDITDSITLQSVTLLSDELDSEGRDQNIQVSYMAQQTSTRWIYRGEYAPTAPQFPVVVPSQVATNILFGHYPAGYTGTLQKKNVGRLNQFDRVELATGVWAVTETWSIRIEPVISRDGEDSSEGSEE